MMTGGGQGWLNLGGLLLVVVAIVVAIAATRDDRSGDRAADDGVPKDDEMATPPRQ